MVSNWQGELNLTFDKYGNKTHLSSVFNRAPLKVQRPFYPEGSEVCHSVILHTAGGIVGGDRLQQTLHLNPHSRALITTAAAAKIYGSNGEKAQQTTQINLAENSYLEWLPQETIAFNNAQYRQTLRVELAPNAGFFGWEMIRFGRSARGEKFVAGDWRSYTEIWRGEQLLWCDRFWLSGSPENFASPNILGDYPIVGHCLWIGKPITPEIIATVRNLWLGSPQQAGVTQTLGNGLLCRYRGNSSSEVRQWFIAIWHTLRQNYYQLSPIKPRIWGIL